MNSPAMPKLDAGQKHVLKLIARDKKEDGWATVSEALFKMLSETTPAELVTFEKLEIGGRARLTEMGEEVVEAMAWL